jgi:hypothetical protein
MTNGGQALGFSPSLLLSFAFSSYCEYEMAAVVAPQGNKGLGFFLGKKGKRHRPFYCSCDATVTKRTVYF